MSCYENNPMKTVNTPIELILNTPMNKLLFFEGNELEAESLL
jgi:hypothetical protein